MSAARGLALASVLTLALASVARAGNDDGVLLGNEAALSGGALTASVDDGSATWYNPAGIAAVERDTVDVSGSVTMLRVGVAPGLLSSATGTTADGSYLEFLGIPSAVTLVRRLDCSTTFGLGLFVPSQTNHTDRVTLTEPVDMYTATWRLTQQESSQAYVGGLTLAFRLAPGLRFGVVLGGSYSQLSVTSQFFGGAVDDATGLGVVAFGAATQDSIQAVSLYAAAGFQWEFLPGFHLGVSVQSPQLLIGALYQSSSTFVSGGLMEPPGFAADDGMDLRPQVDAITPTRVRFGLAYRWARGWIGIDGDIQHELSRPEVGIDRITIGGVRIGGRARLDDSVSIGGGLFTDLASSRGVAQYGDTRIDFFGGSFGFELRSPHRLGEGESAPDIIFVNTFALRYAVGVGEVGGLRFDTSAMMGEQIEVRPVSTTVHEIGLHLGSALYF